MQNINTILREARESRGLTIQDAVKALKVRERHIQMLEDGKMTELAREVYLKGVLKSYSEWLNIDGGAALATVNKEKIRVSMKRANVQVVPMDLSYLAVLASRPGLSIFFASMLLIGMIYIFWYSNHKVAPSATILSAIETVNGGADNFKYSNIREPYIGQDIVFFPHENVELKVMDTASGDEKIHNLSSGDVFFLKMNESFVLSTSNPGAIEVFIDSGGKQELIGTIDKMLINF